MKKGVDIEKIAELLMDSADREDDYLNKIAALQNEISKLRGDRSVSFEPTSIENDILEEENMVSYDIEKVAVDEKYQESMSMGEVAADEFSSTNGHSMGESSTSRLYDYLDTL